MVRKQAGICSKIGHLRGIEKILYRACGFDPFFCEKKLGFKKLFLRSRGSKSIG